MIELLSRFAASDPDALAVITNDGESTYGRIHDDARAWARGLVERGITRFAVVDVDAATVLPLLAASSLVGAEACVYPDVGPDEVADLAARFDHRVLVSPRTDLHGDVEVITAADLAGADADLPAEPPAERPMLMLTTGTTGTPRGVRQEWGRMLGGLTHVVPTPGQRWLFAYGLQQFAGMQILLHVAASGATLVAPAPRRPREGLAAMRAHGVTHASATPTFWRFLLAEMRADGGSVPDLQQVTLGGEAPTDGLLADLERVFPNARISHVYAASEFGATGSVRDRGQGLPTSVLERSEDAPIAMKIVDGELWVRSRVGMLGYYGEPPVDPDEWRPSGDLVEVVGDRILFRGRRSDVINVGGVKVHPLPVEERVLAVPGVEAARVYGRPNPMSGAIVAVDAVLEPGADGDAVKTMIREACADLPAASRPRSVKIVDELQTTGNKVVRGIARED